MEIKALVIEDNPLNAKSLSILLKEIGVMSTICKNADEAAHALKSENFNIAFIDIDLGSNSKTGLEILPDIKAQNIFSVMLTSQGQDDVIEKGYLVGCDDFLVKPAYRNALPRLINKATSQSAFAERFRKYLSEKFLTVDVRLKNELKRIEETPLNKSSQVFLGGPPGTGKTTLAAAIHFAIHGSFDKWIEVKCSTIPENLVLSTLFGHKKGSFTGASNNQKGLLELANGGTLFLDEITTLNADIQNKLLKAIEEKKFYPVGSNKSVTSDFKLISATKDDIIKKVAAGEFREDLYRRICGVNVYIPGLKDRPDDVSMLIFHFKNIFGRGLVIKPQALAALKSYFWPGNVREMITFFDSRKELLVPIIELKDLPQEIVNNEVISSQFFSDVQLNVLKSHGLPELLEQVKEQAIELFWDGNQKSTARKLNVSRNMITKVILTDPGESPNA